MRSISSTPSPLPTPTSLAMSTLRNSLPGRGSAASSSCFEHAPDVIEQLQQGLVLATTRTHCEYYVELLPADRVRIRMRLLEIKQNRVTMGFEYHRLDLRGGREALLVARGEQQIAILLRKSDGVEPAPIPPSLRQALERYRQTDRVAAFQ